MASGQGGAFRRGGYINRYRRGRGSSQLPASRNQDTLHDMTSFQQVIDRPQSEEVINTSSTQDSVHNMQTREENSTPGSGQHIRQPPYTIPSFMETVEKRLDTLEKNVDVKQTAILATLNRLEAAVILQQKNQFDITKASYVGSITKEVMTTFCTNLRRKPADEQIGAILRKYMGNDADQHDKFEAALSFCKTKLNRARGEERRKVVAKETTRCLSTDQLSEQILTALKVDKKHKSTYTKHLAILRKFMRESVPATTFYDDFRTWLDNNYPNESEIDWQQILEEDRSIDYSYDQPLIDDDAMQD